MPEFEPLADIPSNVKLTIFDTGLVNWYYSSEDLLYIVGKVEYDKFSPNIDKVFSFDEIVEAHRHMEENKAGGKIVVTLD